MHIPSRQSGFTLILASLTVAVLSSIAISIFAITYRQFQLSVVARDSGFAFYAADAAAECALYWDLKHGSFGASATSDIVCSGQTVTGVGGAAVLTPAGSVFTLSFPPGGADTSYCAQVTVTKTVTGDTTKTVVNSRGYNTCAQREGRVERAIRIEY